MLRHHYAGGPRKCLGDRYATLIAKVVMAKLVARYRFLPTEKTAWSHNKGDFFLTRKSFQETWVKVEKRAPL